MTITKATRACIVREHIAAGWGVENIALAFGIPVAGVRYEVQVLRASGQLARMFPRASA